MRLRSTNIDHTQRKYIFTWDQYLVWTSQAIVSKLDRIPVCKLEVQVGQGERASCKNPMHNLSWGIVIVQRKINLRIFIRSLAIKRFLCFCTILILTRRCTAQLRKFWCRCPIWLVCLTLVSITLAFKTSVFMSYTTSNYRFLAQPPRLLIYQT